MNNLRQRLGKEGEKSRSSIFGKRATGWWSETTGAAAGEVDLIVLDRRVIVFVEVKTRTGHRFGTPLEAVEFRKQHKMIQAAQFFLNNKRLNERDARFDVVGISWPGGEPVIEHIVNAFGLS